MARNRSFYRKGKSCLALTEAMTLIANGPVSDEVYDQAQKLLSEREIAAVIMAVVAINGWNRIAITLQTPLD
jgi:alkylhydroperoxidase family enzyme